MEGSIKKGYEEDMLNPPAIHTLASKCCDDFVYIEDKKFICFGCKTPCETTRDVKVEWYLRKE